MSPAEKQAQLVQKLSIIPDPQERLAWVVDRARKVAPLPDADRTDANRVQGCVSKVWVAASVTDGVCHFRMDADSTLVKGLAWLVCETCDGATLAEVASFTPTVLEELGLTSNLSPTRLNGLDQVRRRIRQIATEATAG